MKSDERTKVQGLHNKTISPVVKYTMPDLMEREVLWITGHDGRMSVANLGDPNELLLQLWQRVQVPVCT